MGSLLLVFNIASSLQAGGIVCFLFQPYLEPRELIQSLQAAENGGAPTFITVDHGAILTVD